MWTPKDRIKHPIAETQWPSAEDASRALLFQPISLNGKIRLEQRTWIPAMVPWRATEEGFATEALFAWYERFAQGRPGAIVVEATGIRDIPSGPLLRIGHERFEAGLARLVETVQRASGGHTRLFIQLIDFLRIHRRPNPEKFFQRYLDLGDEHRERLASHLHENSWLSASEEEIRTALATSDETTWEAVLSDRDLDSLHCGFRERVTDMDQTHIRDLPNTLPGLFADAAERARRVGFDGVELHYAHAYTMASFLSAHNTRTDGYGGPRERRIRLPLEVFHAVRERVGDRYVLGCRILGDEKIEGGSTVEDAAYFGLRLAEAGVDYLSLSTGGKFEDAKQPKVGHASYPYTGRSGYECMPTVYSDQKGPFARNIHLPATVRDTIQQHGYSTPVVAAGGIQSFTLAEEILQTGQADIIAAARQSLADPDWFLKMKRGRGTSIRRCKFTNYCEALDQMHKKVTCQLWDREDRDLEGVLLSEDGKRRLTAPMWMDADESDA